MDICSYFRSASKSSVASSSSDSEEGNESEMYSSILFLLLNHLPSQDLESRDITKGGKKHLPG